MAVFSSGSLKNRMNQASQVLDMIGRSRQNTGSPDHTFSNASTRTWTLTVSHSNLGDSSRLYDKFLDVHAYINVAADSSASAYQRWFLEMDGSVIHNARLFLFGNQQTGVKIQFAGYSFLRSNTSLTVTLRVRHYQSNYSTVNSGDFSRLSPTAHLMATCVGVNFP